MYKVMCIFSLFIFQVKESFSTSTSGSVAAEVKSLAEAFQDISIVSTNPTSTSSSNCVETSSSSGEGGLVQRSEKFESFSSSSSNTVVLGGSAPQQSVSIVEEVVEQQPKPPPQEQQKVVENKEIQQENIKNALKEIISEIDKVVGSSESEFSSSTSQSKTVVTSQSTQPQIQQQLPPQQSIYENVPPSQGERRGSDRGNEGVEVVGGGVDLGQQEDLNSDLYHQENGFGNEEHFQQEQVCRFRIVEFIDIDIVFGRIYLHILHLHIYPYIA